MCCPIIRVPIIDHCAVDACKSTPRSGPSSRTSTQPAHNPNPHQPSPPHPAPPKIKILLLTRVSPSHHASPSSPPLTPPPFTLPLFPYPIFLSFPLILSTLPSSYPSSLSKSLPPPPQHKLPYVYTSSPSLPPSLPPPIDRDRENASKTGSSGADRNGRYHGMASSRHRLGSAGLGWVEYITVVVAEGREGKPLRHA